MQVICSAALYPTFYAIRQVPYLPALPCQGLSHFFLAGRSPFGINNILSDTISTKAFF